MPSAKLGKVIHYLELGTMCTSQLEKRLQGFTFPTLAQEHRPCLVQSGNRDSPRGPG